MKSKRQAHQEFMKSPEWENIKKKLFKLRGKKCEICGSKKHIQVHHLTYKRFGGKERPEDLQILCGKHHMKVHGIKRKPKEKLTKKRGVRTYKQILHDKYGFNTKGKGWLKLANKLSAKLNGCRIDFVDGNEAMDYVKGHVEYLGIDPDSIKVTFDTKPKRNNIKKEKPKKPFKPKTILRKLRHQQH